MHQQRPVVHRLSKKLPSVVLVHRRKEDEARKEAEAKAERLAQEKSKRSSIRNAKR
eukprot:COSAG06_NODE_38498_length_423_cov_0.623457_1_plen_55_part_10